MITLTRPLFLDRSTITASLSSEFEDEKNSLLSNGRELAIRKILLENTGTEFKKRKSGEGESNSEENGLVYPKILPRAPMPRLGRGLDETLSIFAPARSPPPRRRLAPRLVTSLRWLEPLCQSPATAPSLLQARLFLQAAHHRPWKTEREAFSPRPRTGARTRRSGGWRLREFGSEGKMNIFLSSRYLILRFLLIPPGSSLWQPRLSTP